jgi:adenylate kinase family enzyme
MSAMKKVVVIGTSCSGKTTLARRITESLGVTHIELDSIYWKSDWCPRPTEEFRALTAEAVLPERWVADGNYSKVRDIVWGKLRPWSGLTIRSVRSCGGPSPVP